MKTILSMSGGLASSFAAKLAIETYGKENCVALFADVKGTAESHFWLSKWFRPYAQLLHERFGGESRDTYQFLWHVSYALDIPIERLEDKEGRSIYAIFGQKKAFSLFANKNKFCMASELLKREVIAQWIEAQGLQEGEYQIVLGMGILEGHRVVNARKWWANRMGYDVQIIAPLIDVYKATKKILDNCIVVDWLNSVSDPDALPSAYINGLSHNNCGGFCVLMGQTQAEDMYHIDFNGYMYMAWNEMLLHNVVGIDAWILKIERDGVARGISLIEFIEIILAGEVNRKDGGSGCSCFTSLPAMTAFLAQADTKPTAKELLKIEAFS